MSKKENIALLLNVSTFLDERPAMTTFSQEEILEGIYTAFNLINGECANLPLKVFEGTASFGDAVKIGYFKRLKIKPPNSSNK